MKPNVHQLQRRYVPKDLQLNAFEDIAALYEELLSREIKSPAELEKWLLDASELSAVESEEWNRRFITKSCHTDDDALQARFIQFLEEIMPKIKRQFFKLQKKYLDSPHRSALTDRRFAMVERDWRADVEIFRDENVPLETADEKLVNEYEKICGAMMVQFRGKEYTQQQLLRLLEEPDRQLREQSWIAGVKRRLADREAIDDIFDKLLPLRHQMAQNAGFSDYVALKWKQRKRFDYTQQDCDQFAASVEKFVVPLLHELDDQRARELHVERLRPWDLNVDPAGRAPLRPFAESEIESFVDRTKAIFQRLSPQLAQGFESLRQNDNLDLSSRKGKQPGGYQAMLEESGQPFIFMNAVGTQRDVETMLHEAGHAFHSLAALHEPLVFLRNAPIEFCEVASMSMELFGAEHLDVFYNEADHARARRKHLEGIISVLPWIALIDSFQRWLYTHPGHSREQRTTTWIAMANRFTNKIDWTGFEDAHASWWHKQLHLFSHPLYYIEYGIAQLGALQLWMKAKENPQQALANYRGGLALGGTRPLPELFSAAGIRFDFSEKTIRPLINAVREELERLPP